MSVEEAKKKAAYAAVDNHVKNNQVEKGILNKNVNMAVVHAYKSDRIPFTPHSINFYTLNWG